MLPTIECLERRRMLSAEVEVGFFDELPDPGDTYEPVLTEVDRVQVIRPSLPYESNVQWPTREQLDAEHLAAGHVQYEPGSRVGWMHPNEWVIGFRTIRLPECMRGPNDLPDWVSILREAGVDFELVELDMGLDDGMLGFDWLTIRVAEGADMTAVAAKVQNIEGFASLFEHVAHDSDLPSWQAAQQQAMAEQQRWEDDRHRADGHVQMEWEGRLRWIHPGEWMFGFERGTVKGDYLPMLEQLGVEVKYYASFDQTYVHLKLPEGLDVQILREKLSEWGTLKWLEPANAGYGYFTCVQAGRSHAPSMAPIDAAPEAPIEAVEDTPKTSQFLPVQRVWVSDETLESDTDDDVLLLAMPATALLL